MKSLQALVKARHPVRLQCQLPIVMAVELVHIRWFEIV